MTEKSRRVLFSVARIIHFIVAIVFLFAAVSKALDPPAFVDQIAAYKIFPGLAPFGAWFFITVECLLAGMLIFNLYPRSGQAGAALLLLFFSAITLYAIQSGSLENCGCFGNLMPRTPTQTLIEDLVMLAAMLFAAAVTWNRKTVNTPVKHVLVAVVGITGVMTGVFYQSIPADDFVTQLKPGAHFTSWPTEGVYENLNEGTHIVFLFNLELDDLNTKVRMMNEIAQSEAAPSAVGLITGSPDQLTTLMFQYGTGFPVGALEPRFARNLYRTLPRAFIIHNGYVKETWSRIPEVNEVNEALREIKTN